MNYRCLIVDDEPIAIEILRTYLNRLGEFQVVETYTNPIKAFEAIQHEPVDLLFLDIQMPELTGLELLQALRKPPLVILTTAYREFALDGFEMNALDYLLKPISFDRFLKAIDKFHAQATSLPKTPAAQTELSDHFFIRADRKSVKVFYHDILYLESLKDYVRIVTTQGKFLTKETLTQFEKMLPADAFLRTHRSFIVAKNKVNSISPDGLELNQQLIPVGRMYKLSVEKAILENL